MSNFKITPGPWEVIEHSWSDTSLVANGKTIATQSIYDEATEDTQEQLEDEVTANFRLIAAAPELLSVCLKFKKHIADSLMAKSPFGLDEVILKALGKE